MESTAADHSDAEGLDGDARGNVYGAVGLRRMLERHVELERHVKKCITQRGDQMGTMPNQQHLTMEALEAGLEWIRQSPRDEGALEMIVRRPRTGEREVLAEGELDPVAGLLGDTWRTRGSPRTPDGSSHPGMQLNIMNSRVIALVAQNRERWQLAGDQLFVDMDLSAENVPPGTRLALGSAIIEVTALPHTGCHKFVARFGLDAGRFVNSPVGRQLQLRGVNARVVQRGTIRIGDVTRKLARRDASHALGRG